MYAAIFLGPTLPVEEAQRYLPAHYFPPAAQGDVLRVLQNTPRLIGIIDGYFETVPAVWHKEILYAMERGVHVLGAASMGALRAAELQAFGMVGIGQIFEWYASGELEDDDEVAVRHGSSDDDYRALSEAMVNIRHVIRTAELDGVITPSLGSRVLAVAKALHFSERDPRRIIKILECEMEPSEAATLRELFNNSGPKLKELDAIRLLQSARTLLESNPEPKRISCRLERTVFLDSMTNEIERNAALQAAVRDAGDDGLEHSGGARHEALLRLLARREATRLGFECTSEELREAATTFREAHGFASAAALLEKLSHAGITPSSFESFMEDAVLLEKLDRFYDSDLCASAPEHIRLRTFRRAAAVQTA